VGDLRRAVAFLTTFGGAATPAPGAVVWFGPVGAVVGLLVGLAWDLGASWWSPAAVAGVVVSVDLALTGLLHVDGLADSGDGLLAPMERQRRLDAMRDPAIGAFGVAVVVAVLLARFGSFASVRPAPFVVAGIWAASRTCMAVGLTSLPSARPGGLTQAFRGANQWSAAAVGGAVALGLAGFGAGGIGIVSVAATLVGAAAVLALGMRRLGGVTGDVLGAAGIVGETVGLLTLAAVAF